MGRRGGMQAVELVERDLERPADELPARRRVSRRWLLVPALVVVALVGTQLVVAARDRAETAALAQVPGVVAPVDADVRALWHPEPGAESTLDSSFGVDGALVGLQRSTDNAQALVAIDGRTGAQRWTTELMDAHDVDHGTDGFTPVGGCLAEPGAAGRAACLVTDAFLVYRDTAIVFVPSTTSRLVVVDLGDGSIIDDRPAPSVVAFALLRGLAVTGEPRADGAVVVTASDLLSGQEAWRTSVPGAEGAVGYTGGSTTMFSTADGVGVEVPGHRITLLDAEGTPVRSDLDAGLGYSADPRTADLTVTAGDDSGSPRSTIVGDGPDLVLEGDPVSLAVDDGSVPDLVLMADTFVRAYDRSTGDLRWTVRHASAGRDAIVLRGRVFLSTGGGVIAVDGRTGKELWQAPVAPGLTVTGLATDGRHLLSSHQRPKEPGDLTSLDGWPGVGVLVGYRIDDGDEAWRADLPTGLLGVRTVGHSLVGWGTSSALLG